jgi:hypothetical protein
MTKSLDSNKHQDKIPELLKNAIKGQPIGVFKETLLYYARLDEKTPFDLFSEFIYEDDPSKNDDKTRFCNNSFDEILKLVTESDEEFSHLKDDYFDWCNHLHVSKSLINLLEFLASKKFYRFQAYIELIHSLKPYESKVLEFILGTLSLGSLSLIITFIYNHDLWLVFKEFLEKNGPGILKFLIDYILLAENLALISLFFKIFKFFTRFYAIISNNSKTEDDKLKEIIKLCLTNILVISAQLLCFLQNGIMSPVAGYLFIAASLCDVIWSILSIMQLQQPKDVEDLRSKAECSVQEGNNYCAAKAQFFEQQAFYDQQINASIYEFGAFLLITAASCISILWFPDLFILCVVFQLICSIFKDMLIKHSENKINENLQISVETVYQRYYKNPPSVEDAALQLIKGGLKFQNRKNTIEPAPPALNFP